MIFNFLVNGTGGEGLKEKMTKCGMGWGRAKNAILRETYFLNDP